MTTHRTVGLCDRGMITYDVVVEQNPLPCSYCSYHTHWFVIFPKTKVYLRHLWPVCINCVSGLKEETFRGRVDGAGTIKFYASQN
jgi:hypothetical protein